MSAALTLHHVSYGDVVPDLSIDVWPTAGQVLLHELAAARGRLALIAATAHAEANDLVDRLSTDLGLEVTRLGLALADNPQPPPAADIASACGGATVITDIDVLMWPSMNVSPLQLLTALARLRPTIAIWPGEITGGRAIFSTLGRPDYHDVVLRDAIVIRPRSTRFPDEVPFTIERIHP